MTTAERIKKARKDAGITQRELGEKLGVSAAMIAQYENGARNPKIETLKKIASALHLTLTAFSEDDLLDIADFPDESDELDLIDKKFKAILNDEHLTKEEKELKANELFTQVEILEDYHRSNVETAKNYMIKNSKKTDLITLYFDSLNESGQEKAIEQIELLTRIPEYTKDEIKALGNYLEFIKDKGPDYWEKFKDALQDIEKSDKG